MQPFLLCEIQNKAGPIALKIAFKAEAGTNGLWHQDYCN